MKKIIKSVLCIVLVVVNVQFIHIDAKDVVGDFVDRLYLEVLGRKADRQGKQYWNQAINRGSISATKLAYSFFESKEYKNKRSSDEQFLNTAYRVFLGRNRGQSERYYLNKINDYGHSRAYVIREIAASHEFKKSLQQMPIRLGVEDIPLENRDKNEGASAFVVRCYKKVLGRNYDIQGLNDWTGKIIKATNQKREAAYIATRGFFNSKEFQNRNLSQKAFVEVCYQTFLNRYGEASGISYWLERLKSQSFIEVAEAFGKSEEFWNLLERYGLKGAKEYTASLFMVGDALIHAPIYDEARELGGGRYNFKPMFQRIGQIASQYDLAYYNQETIFGGDHLGPRTYPQFNTPEQLGRDLVDLGFNLVSTANNHTLDMYASGAIHAKHFWNSMNNVVEDGINLSFAAQNDIPVHEVNGITYAFIAYTYGMNGLRPPVGQEYLVNCYTGHLQELLAKVRRAKEKVDVVIVAMHWGDEYKSYPNAEQQYLAQALADAGATIIIGNHAHMIQPIQWLNDGKSICFYALGNLISAQNNDSLVGMMASLTIVKMVEGNSYQIELRDVKADLHYTYRNPNYRGQEVIPFSQLPESYQGLYNRLKPIITSMDTRITVGGF